MEETQGPSDLVHLAIVRAKNSAVCQHYCEASGQGIHFPLTNCNNFHKNPQLYSERENLSAPVPQDNYGRYKPLQSSHSAAFTC